MGHHLPDRLDAKRLDRLRDLAGFPSDRQLALKLGVAADQVGRWKRGETAPSGASLTRLCVVLNTTTDFLFGKPVADIEEQRRRALEDVRRLFGRAESDVVHHMARLTDHHKSILAGRIVGWVEGLEEYERLSAGEMPTTQFDRDSELLRRSGFSLPEDDAEPAGPDAAAPPSSPPR